MPVLVWVNFRAFLHVCTIVFLHAWLSVGVSVMLVFLDPSLSGWLRFRPKLAHPRLPAPMLCNHITSSPLTLLANSSDWRAFSSLAILHYDHQHQDCKGQKLPGRHFSLVPRTHAQHGVLSAPAQQENPVKVPPVCCSSLSTLSKFSGISQHSMPVQSG